MKRPPIVALIVVNACLLIGLGMLAFSPAPAQGQGIGRQGGNYVMIAGGVRGRDNQDVVYILDLDRQAIVGVMYDSNRGQLIRTRPRNVADDMR